MFKAFKSTIAACLAAVIAFAASPLLVTRAEVGADYSKLQTTQKATVDEAIRLKLATPELNQNYVEATTRSEFCKAVINLLRVNGYDLSNVKPIAFSDTDDKDIGIAAALKLASATDAKKNTYSPNASITREQVASMFYKVFNLLGVKADTTDSAWADKNKMSLWAIDGINAMNNAGDADGKGIMMRTSGTAEKPIFFPQGLCKRVDSLTYLTRFHKYIKGRWTPQPPATSKAPAKEGWAQYDSNPYFADFIFSDITEADLPFTINEFLAAKDTAALKKMAISRNVTIEGTTDEENTRLVRGLFIIKYQYELPSTAKFLPKTNQLADVRKTLRDGIEAMRKGIVFGASEAERVNYILTYISKNFSYGFTPSGPHSSYSFAKQKLGSCMGYSQTFRDYAIALGLECIEIQSDVHSWNLVKVDGKWYFVEPQHADGAYFKTNKNYNYDEYYKKGWVFPDAQKYYYNEYGVETLNGDIFPLFSGRLTSTAGEVYITSADFNKTYNNPTLWENR